MTDAVVTDDPAHRRFELRVDGEVAGWIDYLPAGESAILAHTEVDAAHAGEGLGGVLVREVLEQLRARGTTVIPTCPFAAAWIRRHPEYAADVAPALRGQFG